MTEGGSKTTAPTPSPALVIRAEGQLEIEGRPLTNASIGARVEYRNSTGVDFGPGDGMVGKLCVRPLRRVPRVEELCPVGAAMEPGMKRASQAEVELKRQVDRIGESLAEIRRKIAMLLTEEMVLVA